MDLILRSRPNYFKVESVQCLTETMDTRRVVILRISLFNLSLSSHELFGHFLEA